MSARASLWAALLFSALLCSELFLLPFGMSNREIGQQRRQHINRHPNISECVCVRVCVARCALRNECSSLSPALSLTLCCCPLSGVPNCITYATCVFMFTFFQIKTIVKVSRYTCQSKSKAAQEYASIPLLHAYTARNSASLHANLVEFFKFIKILDFFFFIYICLCVFCFFFFLSFNLFFFLF